MESITGPLTLEPIHFNEQEIYCGTCKLSMYAVAGSEDVEGYFRMWVCLNEHCPQKKTFVFVSDPEISFKQ